MRTFIQRLLSNKRYFTLFLLLVLTNSMIQVYPQTLYAFVSAGLFIAFVLPAIFSKQPRYIYSLSLLAVADFFLALPSLDIFYLRLPAVIFPMLIFFSLLLPNPSYTLFVSAGFWLYLYFLIGQAPTSTIIDLSIAILFNSTAYIILSYSFSMLSEERDKLKMREEQIRDMAFHDALTGLPNRYMLKEHVERKLQNKASFAVLFIDLDRFKLVNDTLGHDVGDLLLIKVADRLTKLTGKSDMVSRQGGDEFIICLSTNKREEIARFAQQFIASLSKPFVINGHELFTTPSIGISIFPEDGDDFHFLLKHADTAMYHAKLQGKNNFRFFSSDMDLAAARKIDVQNRLRKALEQGEFEIHYQPVIKVATNEIIGAEALLRWYNADLGPIAPDEFIPIAEETGFIIPLGEWVLYEACKMNRSWQHTGFPPITMSVNMSVRQFLKEDFALDVQNILKKTGLQPQYLHLEVTESIAIASIPGSLSKMAQLKQIGISFTLDNFGTGYASLRHLSKLPIDLLKIDTSLIGDITKSEQQKAMVQAMITVAHSLQMTVIAEGVETQEQLDILRLIACDEGQGRFFGMPCPAEHFQAMLAKFPGRNHHVTMDQAT